VEHIGSALASTANSSQLAVLFENRSNRAVAAFTILYRVKWNDGRETMESMRISNFDPYQWKQRIMPGQISIGSIDGVVGPNSASGPIQPLAGPKTLRLLSESQRITVSLDLVIFEDGQCIGPDHAKIASYLKARMEASARVTRALTDLKPEQNVEDVLKAFSGDPGKRLEMIVSNILLAKYKHLGRVKLLADARDEYEFYTKHIIVAE
jgi:hypothetical protein